LTLLHLHLMGVSALVVSTESGRKGPHTGNWAIADKLWGNKITVYHGVIRAARPTDCDGDAGEEHDTSRKPCSHKNQILLFSVFIHIK
jgi:hypothetical protein